MVRTENKISKNVYAYKRIAASGKPQTTLFGKPGDISALPEPGKQPAEAFTAKQKLTYLYIGKNFRTTLDLHAGFEMSYLLFSLPEALKLLARLNKADKLPSVILLDSEFEITNLKNFLATIRETEAYRKIPVVAEVGSCRPEAIAAYSKLQGLTDLVRISDNKALATKVLFYGKLKQQEVAAQRLNQGFNWDLVSRYTAIRTFDLFFSTICIFLLSPLMLIIAAIVKMDGGSGVLEFATERGLRYQSFKYIRFRTELATYADSQLAELCNINQLTMGDPDSSRYQVKSNQTSRIGSFLKATNLDELPALFNILIGDISFIKSR
jgi:lipopolysaccharide/colanic/teichoic acid biosynthesis glycosyltransferase